MKHIAFAQLVEKLEGTLSSKDVREIDTHISACEECGIQSRKLRHFFAYADNRELAEVPQAVTARLLNIFQPKKTGRQPVTPRRNLLAQLIFDDWQMVLNERHSFSDTRQLLYKIGKFDIDVRLEISDDKFRMTGQVFPDCPNGVAEIFAEHFIKRAEIDENSEFSFDFVPDGEYGLRIISDTDILEIEKIPLRN